jgi:hypothetical protein
MLVSIEERMVSTVEKLESTAVKMESKSKTGLSVTLENMKATLVIFP